MADGLVGSDVAQHSQANTQYWQKIKQKRHITKAFTDQIHCEQSLCKKCEKGIWYDDIKKE